MVRTSNKSIPEMALSPRNMVNFATQSGGNSSRLDDGRVSEGTFIKLGLDHSVESKAS